ncbi:hypothetical protein DN407_30825 (plasmid) [Bacillus sp. JAS24-2]|uniref:hypothetical protein n=1 Tax=Bacillus sp. JAS24-2 TaxID=2217832 RepID=UPI0011EF5CA2|nr:hypothetical protein [Bacillus sp. JAS24-2]QEL82830.1 hypothetical protein DN407_30825 [Bacillus sp. JAS24-2]
MKKGIISVLSVGVLVGGGLLGTQAFAAGSDQNNGKDDLTNTEVQKSQELNNNYVEMDVRILTDEEAQKQKEEMNNELNQANVEKLEGTISTTVGK